MTDASTEDSDDGGGGVHDLKTGFRIRRLVVRLTRPFRDPRSLFRWLRRQYHGYRYDRRFRRDVLRDPTKEDAILLASYPKSGNTYLRFIFANVIALREMEGRLVDYHLLDEMLPTDLFEEDLSSEWEYDSLPCILKTHRSRRGVYDALRSIFLYRNPLDVMVSGFHYFRNRKAPPPAASAGGLQEMGRERYTKSPGEYLREHIDGWCRHFRTWYDRATAVVSYEALKDDPLPAVRGVLEDLNLTVENDVLAEAVDRSSLERVKSLERERGTSEKMAELDGEFARSGEVGQWPEYFGDEDLRYAEERLQKHGLELSWFVLRL